MAGRARYFSLKTRLTTGLAVLLAALLLLLVAIAGWTTHTLVEHYIETRLEHDAESLIVAWRPRRGGMRMGQLEQAQVFQRAYSGHYFIVQSGDQAVRSRSLWDFELEVPDIRPGEISLYKAAGPDEQRLLVRVQGYQRGGRPFVVLVAEDLSPLEDEILRWMLWLAGFGLAGLAVALLLQHVVLRRGFDSLDQIAEGVAELEQGRRERLEESGPVEVLPLLRAVNGATTRLRERIARSSKAAGDLAHALKKHLALLMQTREDLAAAGQQDAADRLGRQLGAMQERMDAELRRARLTGQLAPGTAFHPAQDIPPLLNTLRRLYRERVIDIEADIRSDAPWPVAREDMLELLGNLLDNACKWATHRVRLQCDGNGTRACLIEDDGPGIRPERRAELLQRGSRLDERSDGHGLGLSIANDIAELYGGTLELDDSATLGGLSVRIAFPLQPPLSMNNSDR
jgi:signal transduction histidine kinase